jgi:hypothetical protein
MHPRVVYGYMAALIHYAYIAHAVLTTDQAIEAMTSTLSSSLHVKQTIIMIITLIFQIAAKVIALDQVLLDVIAACRFGR